MKKIILLNLFIGIFFSAISQETTGKRNISTGFTVDYLSSQLSNGNNNDTYEKLSSNYSGEFTFDIIFPLKKRLEIKTGAGFNFKYGDAYLATIDDVRVSEYFVRVPVILNFVSSKSKGNCNFQFYTGIGSYIDILASQKFYFKDQVTIPNNFTEAYGFGSYCKSGIIINVGLRLPFSERIFFDFGIKGVFDFNNLFINPNDNPSYEYSSFGIYLSMGLY